MIDGKLMFDEDFSKLRGPVFGTIRRESKRVFDGDILEIHSPSIEGLALVKECFKSLISELPDAMLREDTDQPDRVKAVEHLRKYYPELGEDTVVRYIRLKWIPGSPMFKNPVNGLASK